MLEYVILLCSLVPMAMLLSFSIVSPDGKLGDLGNEMAGFFHRVISVVAMPYP